jgi:hypothetical protein
MMEQNGAKMDFMYRLVSKESTERQRGATRLFPTVRTRSVRWGVTWEGWHSRLCHQTLSLRPGPFRGDSPSTSMITSSFLKYNVEGSNPRLLCPELSPDVTPLSEAESTLDPSLSRFHCIASSTMPWP